MADPPTEYGDFALKGFLGFQIEEVAEGHARARLTIADEHRNPNGVAHGAVYFAMVDTAMGAATMSALSDGRFCTSVEVELRFIRPAAAGTLIADVSVLYVGGASSISRPGFTTATNGSWQPAPVPSPSSGTGSRPRPVSGLDQVTHRGESNGQRSERTSSQKPQLHRSSTMSWVRPLPTSISWWTNSWTSCRTTHATSCSTGSVKLYVQRSGRLPGAEPFDDLHDEVRGHGQFLPLSHRDSRACPAIRARSTRYVRAKRGVSSTRARSTRSRWTRS